MICPECGREMEPGYVCASRPYMFWAKTLRWADLGGEVIGEVNHWGRAHLSAFRCKDCRLLVSHYKSQADKLRERKAPFPLSDYLLDQRER